MNRVRAGAAAGAACCRRAGLGARGDLPLDALVFGFPDGFRFPIFPLDLAL